MIKKIYSLALDFIQVSSILAVLLTGPLVAENAILLLAQVLAMIVIILAAWEMRRTRYYRVPDIGKQNELVTTGIYKYIRNPMYLAELLFTGVLLLNFSSNFRVGIFVVLIIDLLLKIQYEEKLLGSFFKEFEKYKKTSWRLIPYLY